MFSQLTFDQKDEMNKIVVLFLLLSLFAIHLAVGGGYKKYASYSGSKSDTSGSSDSSDSKNSKSSGNCGTYM